MLHFEEILAGAATGVGIEEPLEDQRLLVLEFGPQKAQAIALQSAPGGAVVRMPADEADAPVPEAGEVCHDLC